MNHWGGAVTELEAVRVELSALRQLMERLMDDRPERQRLYEFRSAAKLLGVAPKTIGRMVSAGELVTVLVRGKRLIPVEEIDRVSRPPEMRSSGATPERVRYDAAAASARLRELRKRR